MTEQDRTQPTSPPPADPGDSPTTVWTPPASNSDEVRPARAEPVEAPRGPSRTRWAIALLVTVLVVAVGAAAVMLLTGRSSGAAVAGYAPASSVIYGELRLDFPGDQKQKLGAFLSKFPGFRDQASLDLKIDDALDRTIRALTQDRQDWTNRIKPWFGGELGVAVGELPTMDAPEEAHGLLILSVTDAAKARAWFDEVTADLPREETTHAGSALIVLGENDQGAMSIHDGKAMLVGDVASVRSAIDTGGRSPFSSEGAFAEAVGELDGEGLGFMFVDTAAYLEWVEELTESIPGASPIPMSPIAVDLMPEWLVLRMRAQDDALAFDTVMPHVEAAPTPDENRAGTLAGHVPASTFVFLEGHDVGPMLTESIELAKQDPTTAEGIAEIEQQAALLGGFEGIFGWWGDTAVAISRDDGTGIHGGLLIAPSDRAEAEQLLGTIRAGVALAGGGAVEIRDEDHNGTPIVIYDFGDIETLAQSMAMGVPLEDLPQGRAEVAVAVTDDIVVLGFGSSFVRAALDAAAGDSLADSERYRSLLGKVGDRNVGVTFFDITAVRELIEQLVAASGEDLAEYERNIKPYLEPLDAIIASSTRDGDHDRTLTLITVR